MDSNKCDFYTKVRMYDAHFEQYSASLVDIKFAYFVWLIFLSNDDVQYNHRQNRIGTSTAKAQQCNSNSLAEQNRKQEKRKPTEYPLCCTIDSLCRSSVSLRKCTQWAAFSTYWIGWIHVWHTYIHEQSISISHGTHLYLCALIRCQYLDIVIQIQEQKFLTVQVLDFHTQNSPFLQTHTRIRLLPYELLRKNQSRPVNGAHRKCTNELFFLHSLAATLIAVNHFHTSPITHAFSLALTRVCFSFHSCRADKRNEDRIYLKKT